ncbi:glyceraldehyde 3-phosphate dehydrogenase NAD-binding domain-containing protein, partial [[Clostridium] scindens]
MAIQIGINGFGRIGRVAFRIAISQPERFHLCGINVRNANLDYMVYMIRYDTIFGRFRGELGTYEKGITVNGKKIPVFSESDA